MKKYIMIIVMVVCSLSFFACGGNVSDVEVTAYKSEMYTDEEVEDAIKAVKRYFKEEFIGCTLTDITYAGDEKSLDHLEWAERNDDDEVIVLISSFDVDASGGDGSLNPNSTYTDWMWILTRRNGGKWKHVDHGY